MNRCYENDYAIVEHDEAQNALILTWNWFAKDEGFKNTMLAFYDLSQQKKVKKWCFDTREQGIIAKEDQQWAAEETIRRNFHIDPIKTAVILPKNAFMHYSVNSIMKNVSDNTNYQANNQIYRVFKTKEEGLKWLFG